MLNPHAVVDAHAHYGRADGQGTFVTVWGRRCCVCHVYSAFDARGTSGQQPGWTLYFSLAAEQMGREAGAAGAFEYLSGRDKPPPERTPAFHKVRLFAGIQAANAAGAAPP
ncbi:hypothetical protein [Hymenobacter sp.]|jgi:hypothetical protein|uniref:hypothetical protein n=1 Tax=Hymenobacter sp. TaxID=1898978 RepID=UPI002EDA3E5C